MASKGVTLLKFVGTVSLGLLTGLSYTLSTVTIPAILALPTASSAARSLGALRAPTRAQLRALTAISSAAFLAAFALSPRPARHPYLLYSGVLSIASAFSDRLAPRLPFQLLPASTPDSVYADPTLTPRAGSSRGGGGRTSTRRLDQSYEVLPDTHSDAASAGEEGDDETAVNGEEVRGEVDLFRRARIVQTAVAGVGFLLSIVGIWGDGVFESDAIVFEI